MAAGIMTERQVMTQFVLMSPPRVFSLATPWEGAHWLVLA
jgi:hypothetical protein